MFVRIKKIKGKEYAYLVENSWKNKSSRQQVKGYIGKVVRLAKQKEEAAQIDGSFHEIVEQLLRQELLNHGFADEGLILKKDDLFFDLANCHFSEKIVLGINEGLLCRHTVEKLKSFKQSENEEKSATALATLLVETGIKVSNEQFVQLFEKIMPKRKTEFKQKEFYY